MEKSTKQLMVTICGGGNGSHASVAMIGQNKDFTVNIFTRKPQQWKSEIIGLTAGSAWQSRGNLVGKLHRASSDPSVLSREGTKMWIISGPAHIHLDLLKKIAPFVTPGSVVGTLYAQGGFDWMCAHVFGDRIKKEKITIFGFFNIPSICQIAEYGSKVRIIGPQKELYAACSDESAKSTLFPLLEKMFTIPVLGVSNFLSLTLTPSNQIIHPGRIYGVFQDWDGQKSFAPEKVPLFYEDMDDFSAEMLEKLDAEIQAIKRAILQKYPNYDLSRVIPLKDRIILQYGDQVQDRRNMKTVFATNQGYATVRIPVQQAQGGVIPDVDGRIFWEDIPFGLCILKDIARMMDVQTPVTDLMIVWHQKFMNQEYLKDGALNKSLISETGAPSRYGFTTIEQVMGDTFFSQNPQPKL